MKCDIISSYSFKEKLQKLSSVNTETKCHLWYEIWHHLGLYEYVFKGRFLVNDAIFKGAKFDGVRYAI